jgi:hypothetical protein
MSRIATASIGAGAAAALTLVTMGTPAYAAGHQASKKTHLAHTHLTLHATQEKVTKNDKFKASVVDVRVRAERVQAAVPRRLRG